MKKILLMLAMMMVSLSLVSQDVKKVAILETVDKDGSVSYGHKLMLRSNLAKAITNTEGYEAYDRTDMDQIVSEQNFQRTGMVSDDQIKQIGIMTGAAYVLIAEAAKVDDDNLFVTAKIVNVESAKTERTDNALISMKTSDIQHGCESMAYKLLGVTPKPAPIQNEIKEVLKTEISQKEVDEKPKVDVGAVPAVNYDYMIGELKTFSDGTSGIVFYVDNDGHGLVVSLQEFEAQWSKKNVDVVSIANERSCNKVDFVGERNTNMIIAQLGVNAVAAARCQQQGLGWYMPSSGELYHLIKIANNADGEDGPISKALKKNGGKVIDGWYWTSSENDDDEAFNISDSGSCHTEEKTEKVAVRAIRAF